MNKSTIVVIGDVHNNINEYLDIIAKCEYSIQLGDLAFNYHFLKNIDIRRHRGLKGNHDCYDERGNSPYFLGDYGILTLDSHEIFYIRGAYSIDKAYRMPFVTWWPNEELSTAEGNACLELYNKTKPDIVISHDCPRSCYETVIRNNWKLSTNNLTALLLDECLKIHQPKFWFHGHHHNTLVYTKCIGSTIFIGLGELAIATLTSKEINIPQCNITLKL